MWVAKLIVWMAATSHSNISMLPISPYRLSLREARSAMSVSVGFIFGLNLGDAAAASELEYDSIISPEVIE